MFIRLNAAQSADRVKSGTAQLWVSANTETHTYWKKNII